MIKLKATQECFLIGIADLFEKNPVPTQCRQYRKLCFVVRQRKLRTTQETLILRFIANP